MSILKKYFLTISKCKYYDICEYYRESSYTCTHGGGEYCGKFRSLQFGEQAGNKEAKTTFSRLLTILLDFYLYFVYSLYSLLFFKWSVKTHLPLNFNHILASLPETKLGVDD